MRRGSTRASAAATSRAGGAFSGDAARTALMGTARGIVCLQWIPSMQATFYYVLAVLLVIAGPRGHACCRCSRARCFVFGGLFLAAWADDFARVGAVGLDDHRRARRCSPWSSTSSASRARREARGREPAGAGGRDARRRSWASSSGIPGLILGPFVGAVAGELLARRELLQAGKVGPGNLAGAGRGRDREDRPRLPDDRDLRSAYLLLVGAR